MKLRFTKMHGIGNDFVVVDCRTRALPLDAAQLAHLGDRHRGIGFDQLLAIEPATLPDCAFAYAIFNTDGTRAGQCGNGVRCIAAWLHREGLIGAGATRLQGPAGRVAVEVLGDAQVRVDMGVPDFDPAAVPLHLPAADRHRLALECGEVEFGAVSMGNPHAVIEVPDVARAPLHTLGRALALHPAFPDGCNVGFAQIVDRTRLRLRVWERGAGATLACGSGACAAVAVLRRRAALDARVDVELPGGMLRIEWPGAGSLWMSGAAAFVFEGEVTP